ncbi:MAG TPA: PAS domain S-box protein, partial [Anaerolineae bacterium]|nr:PAS domain S-box protein [Anaerolineae bacterium]
MTDHAINALLIEDNPLDARLIREYLSEVTTARVALECADSLSAGLERLRNAPPDVLLLDLGLPESQGLDTLSTVLAEAPHTPVVVITGLDDEETAYRAVGEGAQDYLVKGRVDGDLLVRSMRYAMERQGSQEALRHLREFNEGIVQNMGEGVIVLDEHGNVTFTNPSADALLGYEPEELVGSHWTRIVPEDQHPIVQAADERRARGESDRYELDVVRRDGTRLTVLISASPRFADGVLTGTLGVFTDITYAKKAQEEISQLSQFQESIIDNASVWLNVLDEQANVVIWNKAAEEISGYAKEGVLGHGKIWEWLYPDEEYRREITAKAAAIIEGRDVDEDVETTIRRKDGEARVIAWHSTDLLHQKGHSVGSIAIGRDVTEQRQAEEALRRSEEKHRQLADSIADVFFAMDQELRYTFWNKASETLTGIPAQDAMGKSIFEVFPDTEDTARTAAVYRDALKAQQPRSFVSEYRLGDKDFCFDITAYPSRDGLSVFCKDVTERKRAEEALRESEERYRLLFESSPICLWDQDFSDVKRYLEKLRSSGVSDLRAHFRKHPEALRHCVKLVKIVDANQAGLDLYQAATKAELLTGLDQLFTEESYGVFIEELLCVDEGGTHFEAETTGRTLPGERKDIALRWTVAPSFEDTLARVVVSDVDITERKRAEEALRESEERYRTLFERTGNPIMVIDRQGNYMDCNEAAIEFLDSSRDEVLTMNVRHVLPPGREKQMMEQHLPLWDQGGSLETDYYVHGKIKTLELTITPAWWHGKPAVIGVGTNITERKHAEEALEQSFDHLQRTLEQTVYALAATIEMRDPYTAGHQRRVANLAYAIAKEMSLPHSQTRGVYMAGLVHDIGKIQIPAEILSKPTSLSQVEWSMIKIHPQSGYDI